jgi:hypothetical protein
MSEETPVRKLLSKKTVREERAGLLKEVLARVKKS